MKLGKLERIFVNIFTPYDIINPRKYSPNPNTKRDLSLKKWRTVYNAKIRCTEKLIQEIQENGYLSEKTIEKQKRTPCGYLRLFIANNYSSTSKTP